MSAPIEREVRVPGAPARVFALFTAGIDRWWPPGHRRHERSRMILEADVGGRFLEIADDGTETLFGEVLRWEPPHRLVYSWYPGALSLPTEVTVRFTADGDHTLVAVTHAEASSGLGEAWGERVRIFGRAWDQVLPAFDAYATTADADRGADHDTDGDTDHDAPTGGRGRST